MFSASVTAVVPLEGHRLKLTFADGTEGLLDLGSRVLGRGGVFTALQDPEFFRRVCVNHELGTIVWPNGADFCPDVLYGWVTGRPMPFAEGTMEADRPA